MICEIDPKYKNYIKYTKNGKKWLVGMVTKAIYGTLLGSRLFYDKLKGILVNMGFEMNDYDKCTFNKTIDGQQCTIQFHVDDLKLSFLRQGELDTIIDQLNEIFGSEGEMLAASYGKIHEYLGMTIDWSEKGRVMFTMYDYLEDILQETPPEFDGDAVTSARSNMFQTDQSSTKLDE